jgi:hypothetical protein
VPLPSNPQETSDAAQILQNILEKIRFVLSRRRVDIFDSLHMLRRCPMMSDVLWLTGGMFLAVQFVKGYTWHESARPN